MRTTRAVLRIGDQSVGSIEAPAEHCVRVLLRSGDRGAMGLEWSSKDFAPGKAGNYTQK